MSKQIDALKLALDALRMPSNYWNKTQFIKVKEAIAAAEEALAQPEQEPAAKYTGETWCGSVVNLYEDIPLNALLYTTPSQRKPLTDDEAFELIEQDYQMEEYAQAALRLIRRTEAAHGIKE